METTAVATTATTRGEVHGTKATAQAMSFQAQGKPARTAQIQREPKPRTHVRHMSSSLLLSSSPLPWPSLLPPSSPLLWPSLLPPSNPLSRPSMLPSSSPLSWPSLLPPSSPLSWPSLLPPSNPLSRPSLLPSSSPFSRSNLLPPSSPLSWPSLLRGLSSSPSWPKTISTIWTYHRAEGILTIFLRGFDIS